ncbi:MAG: cadmium-translocating P-type ATPase [Phycisphaerales bacterium]|nr:cadmium-translocating P-type ATPase [Phycisphaerales bacterium]
MSCASCAGSITTALMRHDGVEDVSVNVPGATVTVTGTIDQATAASIVTDAGFPAMPADQVAPARQGDREAAAIAKERRWARRAAIGLGIWVPTAVLNWTLGEDLLWLQWVQLAAGTIVTVLVGPGFFTSAWAAAKRRTTNMDTLISIGAGTAYVYSVVLFVLERMQIETGQPMYFTEASVLFGLISLGHWFEARSSRRAGSAIRELLELQPDTAERRLDDGATEVVELDQISPGDHLVVRPGGRLPVDGTVLEGASEIDESLITGESEPVARGVGDPVVSGSLNTVGRLIIEATASGADSTVARITELVSNTMGSKASIQRLTDKVSSIFVPIVLAVAVCTVIGWSILAGVTDDWAPFRTGIISAVTVLIISCPCALGLATPMAIMVGTGESGRRGILIKSAEALEHAASVERVIFDKTGTLTKGEPSVTTVIAEEGSSEDDVVRIAAAAEAPSEHPVARAVLAEAHQRGITPEAVDDFLAVPGQGVQATLQGKPVEVMRDPRAACVVRHGGVEIGRIDVRDTPLPDAAQTVQRLTEMGLQVTMLSGDRQDAAEAIADDIGLPRDAVIAGQTPESKANWVTERSETTIMVGDGLNDAAALAGATVGMAVGSGTNVAIDAADVVIPAHRPSAVPLLVKISRSTLRAIKQNLFLAFVYNTAMIPVAAFGLLGPWGPVIAAGAMAVSDVSVIGNTVRLSASLKRRLGG